jgi:hypothetical protein
VESKPTIRELLDACRADHHDSQRPELAAELAPLARELQTSPELLLAAEKSERFDRSVRAALDDIAVPAGLAERMLARCEAAPATTSAEPILAKKANRFSRRQLIALFSAAASLLILVGGGLALQDWLNKSRPVSNDVLAMNAVTWFDQCGPAATWHTAAAPPQQFPLDSAIKFAPKGWRYLDDEKRDIVAYEIVFRGERALLFVFKPTRPYPGLARTPFTGLTASGGISLGAWQRNDRVYVLAVHGGNSRHPLDVFVRPSRQA